MFISIKARMFSMVFALLIGAAAVFTFFTQKEIEKGMTGAEEQSARNMIHMALLSLESNYADLVYYREKTLESRKRELKDVVSLVDASIGANISKVKKGLMAEDASKTEVLDEIRRMKYGNNDYVFIVDYRSLALSHPDPAQIGRDMSAIKDAKGKYFVPEMVKAARENRDGGYTTYYWQRLGETFPIEKLSYSKTVPDWQWVIGTGIYIDDIEKESQRKMAEMVRSLTETFSKIKIAKTGYMFIFDGKSNMIVHPSLVGEDISKMMNPSTGRYLKDDLIAASKDPAVPLLYLWDKPSDKGHYIYPKESYVAYFKPLDWYVASSVYSDEIKMPAKVIIYRQFYVVLLVLAFGLLVTYLIANRISGPIKELTSYAMALPSRDFSSSRAGSSVEQLSYKNRDEVGKLANAFIFMERSLGEHIAKLTETTAAKERIESELNIAHDIQMSILPKIFPAFPDRPDFDIYAVMQPAKEVGGDFYDFFFIDPDHFCFAIGDVSGKGVPASLFMAVTKTLLKAVSLKGMGPDEILAKVNRELADGNDSCMFVTIFFGIMDTTTGEVAYANAGHNLPVVIGRERGLEVLPLSGNTVVGAIEGTSYRSGMVRLAPGDRLFMYTDGVTEAMNRKAELFSEKALLKKLGSLQHKESEEVVRGVMEEIELFAEGEPQSDDITIMIATFQGVQPS